MNATSPNPKILGRVKICSYLHHLPGSQMGPKDEVTGRLVTKMCLSEIPEHHRVIVREKLDGACVAVALMNGQLHTLNRHGYPCQSSPHRNHHLFHDWVMANEDRFRAVLKEGERLVGDWLAQSIGTRYEIFKPDFAHLGQPFEPFVAFDLIKRYRRLNYDDFHQSVSQLFNVPHLLHDGGPLTIADALAKLQANHYPGEALDGVVYQVQRKKKVMHVCKYVIPGRDLGKYLPFNTGKEEIWNWLPIEPNKA